MELNEKKLSSQVVYEGPIFYVEKLQVELPSGRHSVRDVVRNPNAAAIVAIDEDGKVLMVRQYRISAEKAMLEIPAGKMDPGETPEETALRELTEETGYEASKLELLSHMRVSPGFSSEIIHIYLATGLTKSHTNFDEDEFIDLERYTVSELIDLIMDGTIDDGKTIAGVLAAARKYNME